MTQQTERELQLQDFCKWAESLDMDLTQIGNTKNGDINFSDCNTDYAWEAWKVASSANASLKHALRISDEAGNQIVRMYAELLAERDKLRATIAQQGEALEAARKEINALSDAAYVRYIQQMGRTECLGWEVKVKSGSFGQSEFDAHARANVYLGEHKGFAKACAAIAALISQKVEG